MVRSLRFETKSGGGELIKEMARLGGIMVVERDEEEEGAHVYPIICAELLSGDCLLALREGKIKTLWTPDQVDN
jgi:hypothetical protein